LHPKRSTIGIRVPDHPVVSALLGSSANRSCVDIDRGRDDARQRPEVIVRLETQVDGVIDAGPCVAEPTTIVDLATEPAVIVRRGGRRGSLGAGVGMSAAAAMSHPAADSAGKPVVG
jgi:tRNA A37 threonylcarbamoyladenosine synthetase subunit TsaC/SUA5/YrdC